MPRQKKQHLKRRKDGRFACRYKDQWFYGQTEEEALEARELINMGVQRGALMTAREACTELCERTGAEPVQCIGNKFCIYKPREENPEIILPKV